MGPIKDITVYPKTLLLKEDPKQPVLELILSHHAQMRIKERFALGPIQDKTLLKHIRKAKFVTGHSRPDRVKVLIKYKCQEVLYVVLKDIDMILLMPRNQQTFVTAYRYSTCDWAKAEMKEAQDFILWARSEPHLHLVKKHKKKAECVT